MSDEAEPVAQQEKRLFDRGLVWLGIVVALAAVALGVSFVAEEKPEETPATTTETPAEVPAASTTSNG